jgi:hypothetical protein
MRGISASGLSIHVGSSIPQRPTPKVIPQMIAKQEDVRMFYPQGNQGGCQSQQDVAPAVRTKPDRDTCKHSYLLLIIREQVDASKYLRSALYQQLFDQALEAYCCELVSDKLAVITP